MAGATLGFLKFVLGFDTLSFQKGMTDAERDLIAFNKKVKAFGKDMTEAGKTLSLAITAPLAAFAVAGIRQAEQMDSAMAQVTAGLASMGPVAGKTAEQLRAAGEAFETKSLYDADEVLRQVTSTLLTFGNITGTTFDKAQQLAVDLAAKFGGDLQSAAVLVGKALNDPVLGLKALTRVGISFSDAQKEQIKTMMKVGDIAGAQALIMAELTREVGGAAQAAQDADPWDQLKDSFRELSEQVGNVLIPYLKTLADEATKLIQWFGTLSDTTKTFLLVVGTSAAVLGPFLFVFGNIIKAAEILGPIIREVGIALGFLEGAGVTASGGMVALRGVLAVLTGGFGPLIVAIGLVVLAFADWKDIKPLVQSAVGGLADIIRSALEGARREIHQFGEDLKSVWTFWTGHKFDDNPFTAKFLQSNLTDAAGAAKNIGIEMRSAKTEADKKAAADRAAAIAQAKVDAKAVADAKAAASEEAGKKAEAAAKAAREKAASAAKAAEAKLVSDLKAITSEVFPADTAAEKFKEQLATIDKALAAHKISAEKAAQAVEFLTAAHESLITKPIEFSADFFDAAKPKFDLTDVTSRGWYSQSVDALDKIKDKNKDTTERMVRDWQRMADDTVKAMKGMVEAFKSHDILGGIEALLNVVLDVVRLLASVGTFGSAQQANSFGGPRAAGGPVVPGQTYLVGEKGPEFFSTGRSGYISPSGRAAQPQRVVVVPSPYFDVVVDNRAASVSAPMAGQAAIIGMTGAEARSVRRSRRNLLAA